LSPGEFILFEISEIHKPNLYFNSLTAKLKLLKLGAE